MRFVREEHLLIPVAVNNMTYQKGFTYIELIIYMSIVVMMMATLIPFAWNIIEGGAKSATQQEVTTNARYISELLKYEIRNATGINSITTQQISLATADAGTNPTVITLSGGVLQITKGSGSTINLTSDNVRISDLTFTDFSSSDSKTKHIRFVFTVEANYATTRQEYQGETTIEGSAEVRSN